MHKVYLKPGKEESLKRFHPWIFSGAISKIDGEPQEGEVVDVYTSNKTFIARGHFQIGSIAQMECHSRTCGNILSCSCSFQKRMMHFHCGTFFHQTARPKKREVSCRACYSVQAGGACHAGSEQLPRLLRAATEQAA